MMTGKARRSAGRDTSKPGGSAVLGAAPARQPSEEPTLDQLLAEPIVQQLMRRDRTDEATIRHLLQETAAARPALQAKDDPNTDDPYTIVRLLHETARLWRSRYDREVRQLPGMTRARCTVLIQLAQHEGVNQAALAQILDIRPITLVRLLDRLEAAGFVVRMPDHDDRRAHVLALTAKALPIIESIYDLARKAHDDLQLGISTAEASQLRALLCRIRSNLAAARLKDDPPLRLGATAVRCRELANCHDRAAGGKDGWWNAKLAKASP
jgi:DNA-binding MarR family transcriptional regulator